MALTEDFNSAVAQSKELPSRPSNEDLLQLYALFKQATDGDVSGDRPGGFDFKAISESFFIAVGTPEKVANQIGDWMQRMGTNHINSVLHVADMPHWKAVKNITLFAEEVMPRLRKTGGAE